ncbi:MAG: hypothetical protein JNL90_02975 [Planctomycetes bacterium]|nr:hypothetical protein [Planctomycetota bacterium]
MSAIRAVAGRWPRLAAAGALLLLAVAPAGSMAHAVAATQGRGAGGAVRGDGRGLATFGDRGLVTFGDRFGEGYGDRPLESFGDIPLESMGGLERVERTGSRAGKSSGARERRSGALGRSFRSRPRCIEVDGAPRSRRSHSVATLRGVVSTAALDVPRFALPPVELPLLTLDVAPAETELATALRAEAEAAAARGDAAGASWLRASLR